MKKKFILIVLISLMIYSQLHAKTVKFEKTSEANSIKETLMCLQEPKIGYGSCTNIAGVLKGDDKFKSLYVDAWKKTGRNLKESLAMISEFKIETIGNVKYLYWDMWCKYDSCTDMYNIDFAYMLYNIENFSIVGIFTDSKGKINTVGNINEGEMRLLERHKDHPEQFDN